MPLRYSIIEIFTGEEARYEGRPVYSAVVEKVREAKTAARCLVTRGFAGSYENGEIISPNIEVLSYNMPVKIEILLPAAQVDSLLPALEDVVTDGIVSVRETDVRSHRTENRLIPRQLKVLDVMTKGPVSVEKGTGLDEIIRLLLGSDFNAVPVVDDDRRPVGIITQGDLISRADMPVRLGLLSGLEKGKTEAYLETMRGRKAGDVMTSPVTAVAMEKPLGEAVDMMLKNNLKRMPVVDTEGRLTGMLARFDIFNSIARETPDWDHIMTRTMRVGNIRHVSDVMRRDTDTVRPDAPVEEIIRIIRKRQVQRVAVVDEAGRLMGLVSDQSLLGAFAGQQAGVWDYLMARMPFAALADKHRDLIRQTKMKTAADVMKTDLVMVREDTSIDEAVRLMTGRGMKRIPVVDDKGIFKGMISRDSVLRAGVKKE